MEQNPADVALRSREDGYRGLAPSDPTAHRSLAPEAIAADESWSQLGIRNRVLVALWLRGPNLSQKSAGNAILFWNIRPKIQMFRAGRMPKLADVLK